MKKRRIMVVDDDLNTRRLVKEILSATRDYEVILISNGEACLRKLDDEIDLILLDLQMPGMDGIEVLKKIKERFPALPVVIMTAHGTIERAVSSMKLGSYDFLTKPFTRQRITITVKNALEKSLLEREVKNLRSELKHRYRFENIIGNSGVMQSVFRDLEKVIDSNVTILIQGESGTGKELIARTIHNESERRKNKPFVVVNCTAIPETLLESELFGHERGAFTGATSRRIGKFELANNGTIFLDEIGDMSLTTQSKILRVLQSMEFERVGGNTTVKVDVRLITATNKNLEEKVRQGTFREDLYYRISVFPIKLPPLRERREDIPSLVAHFIRLYSSRENKKVRDIHKEPLKALMNYHWPGNVRELENVIERAIVLTDKDIITKECIPSYILAFEQDEVDFPEENLPKWLERLEVEVLRKTLLEYEGNVTRVARKLGIGRATIYRKAKKYNIPIKR